MTDLDKMLFSEQNHQLLLRGCDNLLADTSTRSTRAVTLYKVDGYQLTASNQTSSEFPDDQNPFQFPDDQNPFQVSELDLEAVEPLGVEKQTSAKERNLQKGIESVGDTEDAQVAGEAKGSQGTEETEETSNVNQWTYNTGFSVFFDSNTGNQREKQWRTRVIHHESGEHEQFAGLAVDPWVNWIIKCAKLPIPEKSAIEAVKTDSTDTESEVNLTAEIEKPDIRIENL